MPSRNHARAVLVVFVGLLAGCGGTHQITVDEHFPRPVVRQIPLHVGLYLDQALTEFHHSEEIEKHGKWSISLGDGQAAMFRHIVPAMFTRVDEVRSIDAGGVDAVLAVSVDQFQFAVPQQTRGTFYEVWIRYQLRLYDPSGALIAEWPLTGYGKANSEDHSFLGNRDQTVLREATILALRDAGAFLTLRFAEVPEVRSWLGTRGSASIGGDPL
jgi:hypothetical protein